MPNFKISNVEPDYNESIQIITYDVVKDADGKITETNAGNFLLKPGDSHTVLVNATRAVRIEPLGMSKIKNNAVPDSPAPVPEKSNPAKKA